MPDWLQDPAALATVAMAAAWLVVRWFRIGKPPGAEPACSRCDHNALAPAPERARGVRSKRLRVID